MIDYFNARWSKCNTCAKPFEYDMTLVKRAPRVCAVCKKSGLARRQQAVRKIVKEHSAAVDVKLLERLAVRSYQEVGDLVGLSAEQVRKIEQAALVKLRRSFAALQQTVQAHLRPEEVLHGNRATIHRGE